MMSDFEWGGDKDRPDQEWNVDFSTVLQVPHVTPKHALMYSRWWQIYWNLDQNSTTARPSMHRVELITLNMSLVHKQMYPKLLRGFREARPVERSIVQSNLNQRCAQFTESKVWASFNWMRFDTPQLIIHFKHDSHRIPSEQELINTAHRLRGIYDQFIQDLKLLCSHQL